MKKCKNKKQLSKATKAANAFMPNPYDPLGSWNGNPMLNPIMPFEGSDNDVPETPTQDADDL